MRGTFADSSSGTDSSSTGRNLPADREERLAAVIEEYLARLESGCACAPQELIAAHPEIAGELRTCLEGLHAVERAAGSLGRTDSRMAELSRAKRLGDFEIVRELGRGGMGIVYEARQLSLGRRVALKVLPFAGLFDRARISRFQAEARAAARLHHPHIVPVYSVGRERGVQYYSMQYIDGHGLDGLIQELRQGPETRADGTSTLSPLESISPGATTSHREYYRAIARLGLQAANALAYAHDCGIAHRDIKPSNFLLDGHGKLWLTDFGLAKLDAQGSLTLSGDLLGTLRYMSPEQALGTPSVDGARRDIYSLGATLYELVALAPAFRGQDRQAILRAISTDEPVSLRKLRPDTPRELETMISKAMEKDPARRYETAAAFAADLERFVENRPIRACRPTLFERALKWSRRHHLSVAAVGVILFLSVIGLAIGTFLVQTAYEEADARRDELEQHLYDAHIRLAGDAYESANFARLESLLKRHASSQGGTDFRGWEWHYLNTLRGFELFQLHQGKEPVRAIAWSRTGRQLASVDSSGMLRVWDVTLRQERFVERYPGPVNPTLNFSPDGSLLAIGCRDGIARVLETDHGTEVFSVPPGSSKPLTVPVVFSPGGQLLAIGGRGPDVRLFDTAGWQNVNNLPLDPERQKKHQILSLAFSPDGLRLAAGLRWPREVIVWDTSTGDAERFEAHHWIVQSVSWSPDGELLASSGHDQRVRLWHYGDRWTELGGGLDHRGIAYAIAWSPSLSPDAPARRRLATVGGDGTLRVHELEGARVIRGVTLRGHAGKVWSLAWSPDGSRIASAGQDGTVRIWDATRDPERLPIPGEYPANWSPDGAYLAFEGEGGRLQVVDSESFAIFNHLEMDREDQVQALAFRPKGDLLAVATARGDVLLWRWKKRGTVADVRKLTGEGRLYCVAWSPDGRWLATGDKRGTCHLWNPQTGESHRSFTGHTGWLGALAFSPDGKYLATTGDDQRIIIRNTRDWEKVRVLQRDESTDSRGETRQHALAWSPDSTRITSGSAAGELVVWEIPSGDAIYRVGGHSASVLSVSWSPDGARIASGAEDRELKIWDSRSGEELLRIRDFDWRVDVLAWHPDAKRLLCGHGFPGSLRILDARDSY